jgi:hypothetical protein
MTRVQIITEAAKKAAPETARITEALREEERVSNTYEVNGWRIERRPNSEAHAWQATCRDAMGYVKRQKGFDFLSEARAYCEANPASGVWA